MNLYGFFRLFWRPASLLIALYLAWMGPMLLSMYSNMFTDETDYAPPFSKGSLQNALPFFLAVAPFLSGHLTGQYLGELLNTRLSWTLPNARSLLFRGTVILGLVAALVAALVYRNLGGLMPPGPAFAVALFWFSAGGGILYTTGKGISSRLRWMNRSAFFAFILGAFLAERLAQFGQVHPFLLTAFGLLGAGLFWATTFSAETWRSRVANPAYSIFDMCNPGKAWGYRKEKLAQRAGKGTEWSLGYLNDRLGNWMRAAAYERCGHSRRGWMGGTLLCSGAAILLALAVSTLGVPTEVLHQQLDAHRMAQSIYQTAIVSGQWHDSAKGREAVEVEGEDVHAESDEHIVRYAFNKENDGLKFIRSIMRGFPLGCALAMTSLMYLSYFSIFQFRSSTRGVVYPLSRARQTQLAFWSSLAHSGLYCAFTGSAFLLVGLAAYRLGGLDATWPTWPVFVRPLVVLCLMLPFAQWFHFRYGPSTEAGKWNIVRGVVSGTICLAFMAALSASAGAWTREWGSGGMFVLTCIVAALVVQGLYYLSIKRYFKLRDLTV